MLARPHHDARRGSIFLVAMILVVVVVATTAAFLFPSLARFRGTEREIDSHRAFFAAEAGISHAIFELNSFEDGDLGTEANPIAFGQETYFVETVDNGDGTYTITSTGRRNQSRRRIVVDAKRRFKSIWDNALIAGPGQTGKVVNGNTTIHGGLYVFGEFSDGSGDISDTSAVVSFSGTAGVKDNYEDLDPGLAARILPLSAKYPLLSEVRLKNGQIDLSGTGTLGQSSDPADGIFTGSGNYGGTAGEANVYSDNGATTAYDMPDSFTLPSLSESYYDVKTGTNYASYDAYATANAFHVDAALATAGAVRAVSGGTSSGGGSSMGGGSGGSGGGWGVTGSSGGGGTSGGSSGGGTSGGSSSNAVVIDDATPAFAIFDGPSYDGSKNRIRWNPTTRLLEVDGVLRTDLSLIVGSANTTIEYQGQGTLYSRGTYIDLHANLLAKTTYPTQSVLGLMTAGDVNAGTGPGDAQLSLSVLFYAEKTFRTQKQTQIAGSIMASYFDMGMNVPQLFAVPSLKDYLPPGWMYYPPMPTTVFVMNWRKG